MYQVEVQVQTLRVPDWISRYCQPERFVPLCSACPQYGKNWACPPGMPQVERIAGAYSFVQVIGLKVLYDEANYILLFDESRGYLVIISGTSDMETLEHIAQGLEIRESDIPKRENNLAADIGAIDVGRG